MGREQLSAALSKAVIAAATTTTVPVVTCVRVRSGDSAVTFSTTNFDRWLSVTVQCPRAVEGFDICIPAKRLLDVVAALPPDKVTLKASENGRKVLVSCGRSRLELNTLPAVEFPSLSDDVFEARAELPATFAGHFAKIAAHASREQSRVECNAVCVDANERGLFLVATDRNRLALTQIGQPLLAPGSWSIPCQQAGPIAKLFGESEGVTLATSPTMVRLSSDGVVLTTRLIGEAFPGYRMMLDIPRPISAKIDAALLSSAVRRARAMGEAKMIVFEWSSDAVRVRAEDTKAGISDDSLPCSLTGADSLTIALLADYAHDALATLDGDELTVAMHHQTTPLTISDGSPTITAIMPLNIRAMPSPAPISL